VQEFNAQVRRDSSIKKLMATLEEEAEAEKKILDAEALIIKPSEPIRKTTPVPVKRNIQKSHPVKNTTQTKAAESAKPKAVMKKRES
jgi:hypothetical protein